MDHWKSACEIQAAIGMVAVLSTFFWTVYLSVYFYLVISKKISVDSERRIMLWFHFTGWGIPLAITAIAKEKGATGYSGDLVSSGWCWISSDQPWWKMLLWMVIAGKGWEILAYIIYQLCVLCVDQVVDKARGTVTDSSSSSYLLR